MKDRIQSWASLVLGFAVVALVAWLTVEQLNRTHVRAERDGGAAAGSGDAAAGATATGNDAGSTGSSGSSGAAATPTSTMGALDPSADGGFSLGSLNTLLDSGAVPTSASRGVAARLGVVLVQFVGAEGAPGSARARPDALKRARELADQAKTDWKAAVKAGDTGSSEDIGRIPRGVLDARTEVAVFGMGKDEISEPLETSKGYWIVKRID